MYCSRIKQLKARVFVPTCSFEHCDESFERAIVKKIVWIALSIAWQSVKVMLKLLYPYNVLAFCVLYR